MRRNTRLAVIVVLSMLGACTSDDNTEEGTSAAPSQAPSSEAAPVSTSSTSTPPTSATGPTTTLLAPVTPSTDSLPTPNQEAGSGVTRPVFADDVCAAISASEGEAVDGVTFFSLLSNDPIPVQVIAEPHATPADAFALVERLTGSGLDPRGDLIDIDGTQIGIKTFDNGNGEAIWTVDDETWGYLRSRGMSSDELAEIIGSLVPNPLDSPFPGFSIDSVRDAQRFQSLHERLNTEITGRASASECLAPETDFNYHVSAIFGDPIYQFGGVIDRPVPVEVAAIDGTVIVISGIADATAPRITDLVNADPDLWEDLLGRPSVQIQDSVQRSEPIVVGQDVILNMSDITDAGIVDSSLRLRLVIADGVSFLEIRTNDLALHPDAEYQMLTVNGRPNSRVTASVGPTFGARLAETALPDPFIVSITITDATDNVLQTSGTIRLIPQPD